MRIPLYSPYSLSPLALLLALAACDDRSPSTPTPDPVPATLAVRDGDGQQGVVGAQLPNELAVAVADAGGAAIAGVTVRFAVVSGGGQVAPETATTDGQGVARARWTLGTAAADSQVVEAHVEGVTPLRLRAQVRAGAPATLTLAGGSGGTGPVGNVLADSLAVTVADRYGNPVAGLEVSWRTISGGGSISPAYGSTGANGMAKAAWTLGPRVDSAQVALARVTALDSIAFTANAVTTGVPLLLSKRSGDGQRGPAGAVLVDSLGVLLRMPNGQPVRGAVVSWSVPASAGTVTPAVTRTDATGAASAVWRLGSTLGLAQASATVDEGVLTFTSLTEADAPATVTAVSGGGAGGVGQALADSLAVRITDRYGNPAAGAVVDWTVTNGGGSVSAARSAADANGIARAQWTLGPVVGTGHAARATVAGVAPIAFSATATTTGVPLQLSKAGGDGQTGDVWHLLADSLTVELRTQAGAPVQGATVDWAVTAGDGRIWPRTARTDAQGRARTSWTLGRTAGAGQVTATVDDGALVFSASGRPGALHGVRAVAGAGQAGTRGTILADSLAARLVDVYGNGIAGAWVRWRVTAGGGQLEADSSRTGADGIARVRWAVGIAPGPNRVVASSGALSAEAHFNATGTAGPLVLHRIRPTGRLTLRQSSNSYREYADTLVVAVRTPDDRPVVGASVSFAEGHRDEQTATTRWDGTARAWVAVVVITGYPSPPLQPLLAQFDGQSVEFEVPDLTVGEYAAYLSLLDEPPYFTGASIRVTGSIGSPTDHPLPAGVTVTLSDDAGWRATVSPGETALWPLGPTAGTRTLTACPDTEYAVCESQGVEVEPRPETP